MEDDLRWWVGKLGLDKDLDDAVLVRVEPFITFGDVVDADSVGDDQLDRVNLSRNQVVVENLFPVLVHRCLSLASLA